MYAILNSDPRFCAPFGALVCGPTMSGKTVWVKTLIDKRKEMINKEIKRVVYCCGEWQSQFKKMKDVQFIKGATAILDDDDFFK